MKIFIGFLVIGILVAIAFSGTIMSQVDEPKYTVIKKDGSIEVREYAPLIVAEVTKTGFRKEAISQGFRALADFIFGENIGKASKAEPIAMTAPVTQQVDGDQWKVRFMMPQDYSLDSLPKPKSDQIKLIPIPAKKYAVIRFSGLATEANLEKELQKLQTYTAENQLNVEGEPIYAFYNPPWTIPFMRRNEILLEISRK